MKAFTKDDFASECSKLGYTLVEGQEYRGSKAPHLFQCEKGHKPFQKSYRSLRFSFEKKESSCDQCKLEKHSGQIKSQILDRCSELQYTLLSDNLPEYKSKTPIAIQCDQGHKFEYNWKKLALYRCPQCTGTPKKSREQVDRELQNLGYKLLGEYEGAANPAKFQCQHGHPPFKTTVNKVLTKNRICPLCKKNVYWEEPEIRRVVEAKGFKYIGSFRDPNLRVHFACSEGHSQTRNFHFFRTVGTYCTECERNEFLKKLIRSRLELVGKLPKVLTGSVFNLRCKDKGHIFERRYNFVNSESDCPICSAVHNIDTVREEFEKIGYTLLSTEYKRAEDKLEFICDKGHTSKIKYSRLFYHNARCPECVRKMSSQEIIISSWIAEIGVEFLNNDRVAIKPYELDVYIPSHNLAVEHCGLYWHSEKIQKDRRYHLKKRKLCEDQGIRLLTFFEDEIIHKPEIVKSIIFNSLGRHKQKIFARKCKLRELTFTEQREFFKKNHLMGFTSSRALGLFYLDELISAFSYKVSKGSQLEIMRFCSLLGYKVPGAFSRFLKAITEKEKPTRVMSYVDLRYGDGSSYRKLGFQKVGETLGFKWADINQALTHNRLYCRSNMDNRRLNQAEYAKEMGLVRVWDSGQAKYTLEMT